MRRVKTFNQKDAPDIALKLSESEFGDENCRFYTSHMLDEVESLLLESTRDSLGREAFAKFGNALSIAHKSDTEISVDTNNNLLTVNFDCKSPLTTNFGKTLETHVNELL